MVECSGLERRAALSHTIRLSPSPSRTVCPSLTLLPSCVRLNPVQAAPSPHKSPHTIPGPQVIRTNQPRAPAPRGTDQARVFDRLPTWKPSAEVDQSVREWMKARGWKVTRTNYDPDRKVYAWRHDLRGRRLSIPKPTGGEQVCSLHVVRGEGVHGAQTPASTGAGCTPEVGTKVRTPSLRN